jgi:hypothetical protein
MSPDQLWIDYCKQYGMDPYNRHMRSIFMAGVEAEREACDEELTKVYKRFLLDGDHDAGYIVQKCSEAILDRNKHEDKH